MQCCSETEGLEGPWRVTVSLHGKAEKPKSDAHSNGKQNPLPGGTELFKCGPIPFFLFHSIRAASLLDGVTCNLVGLSP